jgi:hypothetical protein
MMELAADLIVQTSANLGIMAVMGAAGFAWASRAGWKLGRERLKREAYLEGVEASMSQIHTQLRGSIETMPSAAAHWREQMADRAASAKDAHLVMLSIYISPKDHQATLTTTMGREATHELIAKVLASEPAGTVEAGSTLQ